MSSKIDSLTVGEAREIAALFSKQAPALSACGGTPVAHPYEIGHPYMIRTVTMIDIGRIMEVTAQEIVLEDAAWVADTGRFADALKTGNYSEVEPFPDGRVILNRASVIDAVKIATLNRSQK